MRRKIVVTKKSFKSTCQRFAFDESGATAVEYGIIVATLSLAIIGSGHTVWQAIREKFVFIGGTITTG